MNQDMTMFSPETFRVCREIADELNVEEITQLLSETEAVMGHSRKNRITFVGTQFADVLAAADEAVGFSILPEMIDPHNVNSEVDLLLRYGEEDCMEGATLLEETSEKLICLTWTRNQHPLQEADVELITANGLTGDFSWREKLQATDFVFLVSNAAFLLSAVERKFMRQEISRYLGGKRFGIIMTGGSVINSPEDYKGLMNRVRYELDALGADSVFLECGQNRTAMFLAVKLQETEQLLALNAQQAAQVCADDITRIVAQRIEQAQVSVEQLDTAMAVLEKKEKILYHMGEIAASKAHTEITGTMRYACNMAIEHYVNELYDNIEQTIRNTEDVDHAAQLLPKFLTSAAEQCMDQMTASIELELSNLEARIKEQMAADAGEFFSQIEGLNGEVVSGGTLRIDFQLQNGSKTQGQVNTVSKVILFSAVPLAVLVSVPAALGAVLGSQVIKKLGKEKIDSENREALLGQVQNLCTELRSDLQNNIAKSLNGLGEDVERKVSDGYHTFKEQLAAALEEMKRQCVCAKGQREVLQRIYAEKLLPLQK